MNKLTKKLYIKTYGCQMNVYDSDRIIDMMQGAGYEVVSAPKDADLVILNTCHIREKASEKVFSDLGRIKRFKNAKQDADDGYMVIAVVGCVAQAESDYIFKRASYVDIVLGPQNYHKLDEMVKETAELVSNNTSSKPVNNRLIDVEYTPVSKFDNLPEVGVRGASAFVAIQEGCNNFCAYCVVPYTRGREYSRPAKDIIAEVKILVAGGAKEINVLGQNVNAYHGEGLSSSEWCLSDLLKELATIDGIELLKYTTSHPKDMTDDLIAVHGEIDILVPFLHLPTQSGSDRILKSMRRKHTRAEYLSAIEKLRAVRPDIAFSSDFIVGFPGETDEDFKQTLEVVEKVGYSQAYSFKYSKRTGTKAFDMIDQIPEGVKSERLAQLQDLINSKQVEYNQTFVGKTLPVLFEHMGQKDASQLTGRSPYMHAVYAKAPAELIGRIADVKIIKSGPNSLVGEV
ncbi:MAG: tRNA (N6-isopentenyl adenosine(37)-C2)-methylthiotransferase MiaB [Alphaproteobacteria bacterium]|nr:tRNA (N6-isopentenyl adenosine(37)-C2)-methylthiotransferase MiaB [Alphaproteobacteria bacterium]